MTVYEGKENLDIMSLAVNYNNAIYKWIIADYKNGKILDFGCGKGEFCNRKSKDIYAVEIDKSMHGFIKCPIETSLGDFDMEFDLIYSSNVLEHIENDVDTLKLIYKKVKKNGTVKILVPSRMELYTNMDKKVGHYRRYEQEELIRKVEMAGFEVEYCKYFDFLGYFATLAFKVLSNKDEINEKSLIVYDKIIFPISRFFDTITNGKIIGKNLILKAVKSEK